MSERSGLLLFLAGGLLFLGRLLGGRSSFSPAFWRSSFWLTSCVGFLFGGLLRGLLAARGLLAPSSSRSSFWPTSLQSSCGCWISWRFFSFWRASFSQSPFWRCLLFALLFCGLFFGAGAGVGIAIAFRVHSTSSSARTIVAGCASRVVDASLHASYKELAIYATRRPGRAVKLRARRVQILSRA